jgi:hypothetical protein
MATTIDSLMVSGSITVKSDGISAQDRSSILRQDANAIFPIDLTALRVWDAFATNLPGTAATDDLALVGGTFGTSPPVVSAGDLKAPLERLHDMHAFKCKLPECYDSGETITL